MPFRTTNPRFYSQPIHPGKYEPHSTWRETLQAREEALRCRHMKVCERLSEHTKHLCPLKVGDYVRIQNQTGPYPKKWGKTGVVIEVRQFDQYVVRVDGYGRITVRNRKFLRKYVPVVPNHTTMPPIVPPSPEILKTNKQNSLAPTEAQRSGVEEQPRSNEILLPSQPLTPNRSVEQPSDPPMPRMLPRLHPYNAPGLKEDTETVLPRLRSMRQLT